MVVGPVMAAPIIISVIDDAGPDDPGVTRQADLNQLTFTRDGLTITQVGWNWDDTLWTGGNSGDACALYDTNTNGYANYAVCVHMVGHPIVATTFFYSCSDKGTDRCTSPQNLISPYTPPCTAGVVANSDPFGAIPDHTDCYDGGTTPTSCRTDDTVASCGITNPLLTVAGASLINVCSYNSASANSNPNDCVVAPGSGFLTIVKVATPDDGTAFTFNSAQQSQGGVSSWPISGSGAVQLISFAPGTTYDLSEVVPAGWNLDGASCAIQTSPATATGTKNDNTINDFEIRSGLETVCTFTDTKTATLTLNKIVTNDNGGNAAESAWTLTADGSDSNDLSGPGAAGSTDVTATVIADTFALSENVGPVGYTAGDWVCTGFSNGGSQTGASVTVNAGEVVTCTITNDDVAPKLTVVKDPTNDDGGNALPDDFLLTIGGNPATSGTAYTLDANTAYAIDETQLTGGTFVSITGDAKCPAALGGSITLDEGDDITCTLTNDDVAPTLTLIKDPTNDDGGNALPDDFDLMVGTTEVLSGVTNEFLANTASD
jgi:hypothetical protein